jgi:hypothetical protein
LFRRNSGLLVCGVYPYLNKKGAHVLLHIATVIAILLAIVVILPVMLYLAFTLWSFFVIPIRSDEPASSNGDASSSRGDDSWRPEPWDKPFTPTGAAHLPNAVRLNGKAYRWQAKKHIHRGADFHLMFEDGPWKWDAQGRFAGKDINCGHYFGLSVEAANEEAGHYGIDKEDSQLIEIEGSSDCILDLTHPDLIRKWFELHIDNHKIVSHSIYRMFQELIEQGF